MNEQMNLGSYSYLRDEHGHFFNKFNTEAEPFSVFTTFNTSIMKFSAMLSLTCEF